MTSSKKYEVTSKPSNDVIKQRVKARVSQARLISSKKKGSVTPAPGRLYQEKQQKGRLPLKEYVHHQTPYQQGFNMVHAHEQQLEDNFRKLFRTRKFGSMHSC